MTTPVNIETDENFNIDEFLPMPGAESVVTGEGNQVKTNVFSKSAPPSDFSFLDKKEEKKVETPDETKLDEEEVKEVISTDAIIKELDEEIINNNDDEKQRSSKKIDKSGLVEVMGSLIKEEFLIPFDDDKPLEEYTMKDWKELIQANFEEKEKTIKEKTPIEFFESLPAELRYAAEYVAKGGTDLKGMFRALSQVEEVRQLDPRNADDQEKIVRQYLQATIGDPEMVEEQIQEWVDAGTIAKKAAQIKPKLDSMQEEVVQSELAKQETVRQEQIAKKEQYMENIYKTLKPGELNGLKLDNKRQKFLWDEMTTVKYQSMTGRPTNLLGKLLEDYQFGKEPRYDLIAEAVWLLSDPDDYKQQIKTQASNEVITDSVRKLKSEESRKIATTPEAEEQTKTNTRKITRPGRNIFQRG